jgi:glycosyltransferase involved in cell wall biosynthesis
MACGAACILSDLPWAHELISDGIEAVLIPVDSRRLAETAIALLGDDERRRALADAGRALVARHLDREREMDRLLDLYRRLAAEG